MKKIISISVLLASCVMMLAGCGRVSFGVSMTVTNKYDNADKYTMGGATLSDKIEYIDVNWLGGSVNVQTGTSSSLSFSESSDGELDSDSSMYYYLNDTTLYIQYSRSGKHIFSELDKDLTLTLPSGIILDDMEIDTVSADVNLQGVASNEADIETVSGDIELTDCTISKSVKFSTVSGNITSDFSNKVTKLNIGTISGKSNITATDIEQIEAESVSGRFDFALASTPKEIDISTVSGDIELSIPAGTGFTVDFDTASGDFSSKLSCENKKGKYVYGDGSADFDIETVSADINITEFK